MTLPKTYAKKRLVVIVKRLSQTRGSKNPRGGPQIKQAFKGEGVTKNLEGLGKGDDASQDNEAS